MDIQKIVGDFVKFAGVFTQANFARYFDGELLLADYQVDIVKEILVAAGHNNVTPRNLDGKHRQWINTAHALVMRSKDDAIDILTSEITGRQTLGAKIQVTEFQDFLITPKLDSVFSGTRVVQLGLDSKIPGLDEIVGIHAICEGTFVRRRRNQSYHSFVCMGDCGVVIPVRVEVKTYRDLTEELTR